MGWLIVFVCEIMSLVVCWCLLVCCFVNTVMFSLGMCRLIWVEFCVWVVCVCFLFVYATIGW